MLKRLANWLFLIAYRESFWQHAEAIRREYLTKGIERGRATMRVGTLFDLYLARADADITMPDAEYHRAAQMGGGAQVAEPGVKQWRWWACVNETGAEVCIGPLDTITLQQALRRYLELLPAETLNAIKETLPNG